MLTPLQRDGDDKKMRNRFDYDRLPTTDWLGGLAIGPADWCGHYALSGLDAHHPDSCAHDSNR